MIIIRYLTHEETMTWGVCPTCGAAHGDYCNSEVGMQLGVTMGGGRLKTGEGAHLSRLNNAPKRLKIEGIK
jgi:hypothetical protein